MMLSLMERSVLVNWHKVWLAKSRRKVSMWGSLLAILLFSANTWAQVDPSTSLLLRGSGSKNYDSDLDSSRYRVREPKSREAATEVEEEKSGTSIPTPVPSKTSVVKVEAGTKSATTQVQSTTVVVNPEPTPPAVAPAPPPVTTQVKELFFGNEEEIAEYKKQVHSQDPRGNFMEISLAPAYFYNDQTSGYSFHNLNTQGPGFDLGANIWLTPFFGLRAEMFSSVASSVRSGGNEVSADYNVWDAGLRFRKHFGFSRKAPQLSFGIDYHESTLKISKEAIDVVGSKSTGVGISLEGIVPSSVVYAHTFGLEVKPRLKHYELSTGVEVKSGSKTETNTLGLSLGGQWTLDRRNQVFWRVRHVVERNLYEGAADTVDLKTGSTPEGVSVTNSLSMFYFGFKWGS